MIEMIGWSATLLVLLGYFLNSVGRHYMAMWAWIIGDIGWITYDIIREIHPHLALSSVIILINIFGIYRILKDKQIIKSKK